MFWRWPGVRALWALFVWWQMRAADGLSVSRALTPQRSNFHCRHVQRQEGSAGAVAPYEAEWTLSRPIGSLSLMCRRGKDDHLFSFRCGAVVKSKRGMNSTWRKSPPLFNSSVVTDDEAEMLKHIDETCRFTAHLLHMSPPAQALSRGPMMIIFIFLAFSEQTLGMLVSFY